MLDHNTAIDHHVQRHILDVLRHTEFARFRDLRPDGLDSNAFSYHLTTLLRQGFLEKTASGYTLTIKGIAYIDRVSAQDVRVRKQPKIMTITAVFNESGEVLLRRKTNQPMINRLTLPSGMLHMEDATIRDAAQREVREKMGIDLTQLTHAGDCYMAIRHVGDTIMNSLMHVFTARVDSRDLTLPDNALWRSPDDLAGAAPATRKVIGVLKNHPGHERFFEEFSEEL